MRLREDRPAPSGDEVDVDAEPGGEPSSRLLSMAVLAAGAAKDMMGPISYLLANLEYVEHQLAGHESDLPPGRAQELRQCVREAMSGATRVREIVRELPLGSTGEEDSHIDLRQTLLSCIKIARTEIDHRARVITEFDAVPTLYASESRLSRLFLNLILNAAQAVAGDAENEHFIRVVTRNDGGRHVIVEIADSGPGIPEAHLERVFEPFFTTKPANEGTGLGLTICRQIAEELGGGIAVESTFGRGATFRVTLPTARARLAHGQREGDARFSPSTPPVRRLPLRQLG